VYCNIDESGESPWYVDVTRSRESCGSKVLVLFNLLSGCVTCVEVHYSVFIS